MYEKKLAAIAPRPFVADGTSNGKIVLTSTHPFKVKQIVTLRSATMVDKQFEVKRVENDCVTMYVGPLNTQIEMRSDITAYLVADGAEILSAEQKRPIIPEQEIERHTYEEEPVVARRCMLVDTCGNAIRDDNPLPIDGTITVTPEGSSNPFIVNVSAPAVAEYVLTIPQTAKQFLIKMRGMSGMKISWVVGETLTNFISVSPGSVFAEDGLRLTAVLSLYVRTTKASDTIELLYWT